MVVMSFSQFVSETAVNTGDRLVSVEIDVNLGMTKSRVGITFASYYAFVDNFGRNFSDQVDCPTSIGLLFFANKSGLANVIFGPDLTSVSDLLGSGQSLENGI